MTKPHIGFQIMGFEPVTGELNTVIVGHRMNQMAIVFELTARTDMRIMHGFTVDLVQPAVTGFTVHDAQYGPFVGRTDDGIAFQVSDSGQLFDNGGALVNKTQVSNDFPSGLILFPGFAFLKRCLQMGIQNPPIFGITINMEVYGHMQYPHVIAMFQLQTKADTGWFQARVFEQLQRIVFHHALEPIVRALFAAVCLIAFRGFVRVIGVNTATTGELTSNGFGIAFQCLGDLNRSVTKLNCTSNVVSFP